jgi:hypothetical protein
LVTLRLYVVPPLGPSARVPGGTSR